VANLVKSQIFNFRFKLDTFSSLIFHNIKNGVIHVQWSFTAIQLVSRSEPNYLQSSIAATVRVVSRALLTLSLEVVKDWTPSISREQLKLETSNLARI